MDDNFYSTSIPCSLEYPRFFFSFPLFFFFFLNLFPSSSAIRLNQRSFVVGRRARKAGRDERGGIVKRSRAFLSKVSDLELCKGKEKISIVC